MPCPWLITRPAPEAEADARALAAAGVAARAFPVLVREPLAWDEDLGDAGLLLLSSASALEAVARAWQGWTRWPRVLALGPQTAGRARALGLPVDREIPGGVSALVDAALGEAGVDPVLYPTSDRGLASEEQRAALARLRAARPVRAVAVVSVRPAPDLALRLAALDAPARWTFASPSAVDALFSRAAPAGAAAALCHGASTGAAYLRRAPPSWPPPLPCAGDTLVARVLSANKG